jgi:acyl carrier protein
MVTGKEISPSVEQEIRGIVYDFFSEECGVDRESLTDETNIIEELEGDSLMLLSLLETVRTQHGLTIELKVLGGHLMKRPANTIGEVLALTLAIVKYGDDVVNVEF